jgi:hypothetical protein
MRRAWWTFGLCSWIVACGPVVQVGGDEATGTGSPSTSASGAPSGTTAALDDGAPGDAEVGTTPPDDGPPIDVPDLGALDEGPVGTTGVYDDGTASEGGTTWGDGGEGGPLEPGFDTDAGEPGGVGPAAIEDPIGDVELSNADAIASAVYTDGVMIDFRAQLVDRPFPADHTYDLTWCLDLAGVDGDWSCMTHSSTIDAFVGVDAIPPYDGEAYGSETPGLLPCEHGSYEPDTKTLRLLVPLELAGGSDDFEWTLLVNFSGSGGDAEFLPDVGAAPVQHVDAFPPFAGIPSCY